jgi:hypothetical protein
MPGTYRDALSARWSAHVGFAAARPLCVVWSAHVGFAAARPLWATRE